MAEETGRLHVLIEGLVQGVGFRHAAYLQGTSLELTGWVRNLADGRVEATLEGPEPVLEDMLAWCHQGPYLSRVTKVEAKWGTATGEFDSFRIAF